MHHGIVDPVFKTRRRCRGWLRWRKDFGSGEAGGDLFLKGVEGVIRLLEKRDYAHILDLAREVEPLFGKMAGEKAFDDGIEACVKSRSGLCCEGPGGVEGILILDRVGNAIEWFVVSERSRGKGLGKRLLGEALDRLDAERDVMVQTFAPHVPEGMAARALYMKMGFSDVQSAGKNPAGVDTVMMRKRGSGSRGEFGR